MSAGKKLLLVNGDAGLRQMLTEQLVPLPDFASVDEAASGGEGLSKACASPYDLILLDMDLPDMSGRAACEALRASGVRAPILMLAALVMEEGQDAGANDYITKPFRLAVLLARIRALLRQQTLEAETAFSLGPYVFHPAANVLSREDGKKKIRLTEKETAILKRLVRVRPAAVAKEQLLGEVWGYTAGVDTHTLETHIYRLRRKIEPDPAQASLLITDQGGYRLGE